MFGATSLSKRLVDSFLIGSVMLSLFEEPYLPFPLFLNACHSSQIWILCHEIFQIMEYFLYPILFCCVSVSWHGRIDEVDIEPVSLVLHAIGSEAATQMMQLCPIEQHHFACSRHCYCFCPSITHHITLHSFSTLMPKVFKWFCVTNRYRGMV